MRRLSTLALCSVSVAAMVATPAFAQTTATVPADQIPEETQESEDIPPTSTPTNAEGEPAPAGNIVVTGSRIRRDNFTTPQNIDVLSRDDQVLAGTRSTAETLQSGTVTSGTSQISGSFLGFLSEGGQGANVVGLRGLGSTRTLVLLNGRRLAPAGVGPQLVSADLNVLPTSAVQRIEILREGASSIYGSDAIAGVINVIADTEVDGLTVDAFADVPLDADDGRTYRISGTFGKTFSRGHIMGSLEYRRDEGLTAGSREDWRCPRELAFINGQEVGQLTPDGSQLRCFPFERVSLATARGYGLAYSTFYLWDDYFGGEDGDTDPDVLQGFAGRYALRDGQLPLLVNDYDLRPETSRILLDATVFTPVETYTGYANGAYELDALGGAEIYGEALYSRRKSNQVSTTQLNFQRIPFGEQQLYGGSIFDYNAYYGFDPDLPAGTVRYLDCQEVYGDQCSPFFPDSFADEGINYFGPFIQPERTFPESQRVDFFRGNVGIRGNLGFGDWRYDVNGMVSRTRSEANIYAITTEEYTNAQQAVLAPAGTPAEYLTYALPGQAGAGNAYTCAVNVTGGAYNGGDCVVINAFDPNVVNLGILPDGYYDYIYADTTSRTKYNQETFNVVLDGSLFRLLDGTVKAAVGFEHRRDYIKDTPSAERQAGALYNYGAAKVTEGKDKVNEFFGELQIPLLRDRPFFNTLEFNVAARYTDYDSYGSQWTYSAGGQWAPAEFIRFRGNYGTNFRAPNLYEQFVADEVGFYPASLDPCDEFGTLYSPGAAVYDNCLAELTPILDDPATPENEALDFFGNGSIQVTTTGGRGVIEAETAKTWGFGTVITMPRHIADFSLAVDYFDITVKGQVNTLGNLILNFCYQGGPNNDLSFPDNEYCQFINGRVTDPGDPSLGQIDSFRNPYLNISKQISRGIDFDARYATDLFGGRLSTQLQATRMIDQKLEYFPGSGLVEYNGTLGYPGFGSGPKWVGSLDTRFKTSNDITFRWGVEYVGRAEDTNDDVFLTVDGDVCSQAAGNCVLVDYDSEAEPYWEHGASVQWLWRDVGQVTMGVNNVFNEKPPTISAHPASAGTPRIGNWFANGPYDYRGRSFFINVTRSF